MLQEAFEYLVGVATRASSATDVHRTREKQFVNIGGEVHDFDRDIPGREHVARNIEVIAAYATDDSSIWHSDNNVTLLIDDDDRHKVNKVTWPLSPSARYLALVDQAKKPRGHKAFVQFLVQNLREELDRDVPGLLGKLRTLKFSTNDESEGEIKQGRESMGRSVQRAVAGIDDMPETITLNVCRWGELDITVPIESMLVLDLDDRTLALRPLADSTVLANLEAHEQLGEYIKSNVSVKCLVHHGEV